MKVSELIADLKAFKAQFGDTDIEIATESGKGNRDTLYAVEVDILADETICVLK